MAALRLIGRVLLLLLTAPAWGQGMSVGGAGLDDPDPLSSDPFAADAGMFGVDDPAGDGPAFTGQDVLAVLSQAELGCDLPLGLEPRGSGIEPPSALDQSLGSVGEVRLTLAAENGAQPAAIWRAFGDPGDAVGALPRLAASLARELNTDQVGMVHTQRGSDGFTCALARPSADRAQVMCGLSVSLDPLQALGMVTAALPPEGDPRPLIDQAVTIAAWARDRWLAIQDH